MSRISRVRHLAVVIAVVCFAAALYSPLSAQTPPESTPASLPDEFGGEIFDCEIASNPTGSGDVEIEESHVTHLCADNHTHSWWNSGGSAVGLYEQYGRAHTHSKKAVTAGPGVYQPQEIAPGEDFIIDAPVISGPRVCSEPGPRPSAHKRGEAWGMLNCEVKRVVETIVAATGDSSAGSRLNEYGENCLVRIPIIGGVRKDASVQAPQHPTLVE